MRAEYYQGLQLSLQLAIFRVLATIIFFSRQLGERRRRKFTTKCHHHPCGPRCLKVQLDNGNGNSRTCSPLECPRSDCEITHANILTGLVNSLQKNKNKKVKREWEARTVMSQCSTSVEDSCRCGVLDWLEGPSRQSGRQSDHHKWLASGKLGRSVEELETPAGTEPGTLHHRSSIEA